MEALVEEALGTNWVAMFASYCAGATLVEISQAYAIPLPAIQRVAAVQGWGSIAARVAVPQEGSAQHARLAENRMALLEENRRKNYDLADSLRTKLVDDFQKLRKGELKVEKVMTVQRDLVHIEVEPGPQDLVALANAAKQVADMTYRALGDQLTEERKSEGTSNAQAITVILPTVIHAPTPDPSPMRVVDLRPTEIAVAPATPAQEPPKTPEKQKPLVDYSTGEFC
jgi:hypothetical protein